MKYLSPEEARTRIGNLRYLEDLRVLSRKNRKIMTEAEEIIWGLVRRKNLGFKFIKQKPVGKFILDFYCSKLLLAIEIDGGYHRQRKNYDNGRDVLLFIRGIKTLRFKNEEVINNLERVKKEIENVVVKRYKELK